MKKTLKMLSVVLAMLMLLSVFAACKKDDTPDTPTTQPPEDEKSYPNDLEAKDLGGQEFMIFDANDHPELHFNFSDTWVEGNAVKQALFERDTYLEG